MTHLCSSDVRYRAALQLAFLAANPPPMYITLYYLVTRLPDSLCAVRDHFLALDPTETTLALLDNHLLEAKTSSVAVVASRGTPCSPFFEGRSVLHLLLVGGAAAARARGVRVVGGAQAGVVAVVVSGVEAGGGSGGGGGGGGGGVGRGGSGGGRGGAGRGGGYGAARGGATHGGGGTGGGQQQQPRQQKPRTPQELRAWVVSTAPLGLVSAARTSGALISGLEIPNWLGLLGKGVDVFALEFDKINAGIYAMYAGSTSIEGACYSCMPRAAGVEAAALGASESAAAGTASAEALHTFTLDSGASRSFFRDCTTVTQLTAFVSVSLADPSGGPVVARASTVLPCPAVPSGSLLGLHLPSFSKNLVAASCQVTASGQLVASCSCRLLSHQTLLWHHRLGHPSLPCLRGMHSRLLVSSLLRSLPPLPRSLAPPCLPCVEGRQRIAPHFSSFPLTIAPLWTLHIDMWGPARVCGQDQERYFLIVVDDYTRYTTVFPLRSKADFPGVLRLQSDRGGEFSAHLFEGFCRAEGIAHSFTLSASPQENGIAERRIGMLNLWPHVSEPETSPTLRWPGEVGDASAFRVWGALSLVRDTTAGKFSPRTLRCVFLGFPTDAPPWQFYHPASRRVLFSQDITFDELACFYRLHPHASSPVPSPPLFLVDPPPLVDLLEVPADTSGPAEGGDSAADDTVATRRSPRLETPPGFPPRPSSPPLQPVAMNSGAAGGGDTGGVDSGGAGPRVADSRGAGSGGAADSGGAASPSGGGVVGAHDGAWSTGAGGVGAGGAAGARGTRATGARRASAGVAGGASGAGGAGSRGAGGTGAAGARGSGVGGAGGTGAAGAGGARVGGTGGTGSAGAGGTGAGGNGGTRAAGAGGAGAGGAGATSGTGTAPRRPFFYPQPQSSLPPRVFRHFVRFLVFRLPLALLRLSCVLRLASHSRISFFLASAAHQLNLWPRVSLPQTSPTLRWMGELGDASVFGVWGALSLVRDTITGKLSPRTLRCVFLGFPIDALPWQFYHPASRRVLSSEDVIFDESVCFYRLHPHTSSPLSPSPLFLVPGPPQVDPLPPQGPAPSGPVAVDSGAAGGADSGGAGPEVADTRGADSGGASSGGADIGGAASPSGGGVVGAPAGGSDVGQQQQSPTGTGGAGAGGTGDTGAAGAGGARAGGARGTGATGAGGTGVGGAKASGIVGPGAGGAIGAGARVALRPLTSSLPNVPDPESDLARAASPTVTRLLATVITNPSFKSTVAFTIVTELVDFVATRRLDYVASLVTESASVCPPSIGGKLALSSDVLEDKQFELECLAADLPRFASMLLCPEGDSDSLEISTPRSYAEVITAEWQTAMDAEMASWKSTGTYEDEDLSE
ncbi:unnamed protein product [Closterium sp. NIES-53]